MLTFTIQFQQMSSYVTNVDIRIILFFSLCYFYFYYKGKTGIKNAFGDMGERVEGVGRRPSYQF